MLPATANPGSSSVTLGDIAGELIAVGLQQKEFDQTQKALVGQDNPSRSIYEKLSDIEKVLVDIKNFFIGAAAEAERRRDMSALQTEATGTSLVPLGGNVYEGEVVQPALAPPTTQPEQDTELTDQQSLARKLFGGLLAIGGGAAFLDVMENVAARNDPSLSAEQQERASDRLTGQAVGGVAGIAGGALAGAKLGGTLGTIFGPVGTALGAAAGGAAGGVLGVLFGDEATDLLLDDIVPNLTEGFEIFKEGLSKDVEQLGETFSKIGEDLSTGFDKVVEDTGKSLSAAAEAIGLPSMEEVGNFFSSLNPFSDDGGPSFAEMREEAGRPKGYDPTTGRPLSGGQNTGVPTVEEQRAEDRRVRRSSPRTRSRRSEEAALRRDEMADKQERLTAVAREMGIENTNDLSGRFEFGKVVEINGMPVPQEISDKYPDPNIRIATKEETAALKEKYDFLAEGGPVESGSDNIVGEEGPELFIPKEDGTVLPADVSKQLMDYKKQGFDVTVSEGQISLVRELDDGSTETIKSDGTRILSGSYGKLVFKDNELVSRTAASAVEGLTQTTIPGMGTTTTYRSGGLTATQGPGESDVSANYIIPSSKANAGDYLQSAEGTLGGAQSQPIVVNAPQSSSPTINNTTVTRQLPTMSPRTHDESFTRTNNQNYNFG